MEVVTLNDRAPTEEEAALGARVRERAWAGKLELPMLPEVVQRLLVAVSDERSDARDDDRPLASLGPRMDSPDRP